MLKVFFFFFFLNKIIDVRVRTSEKYRMVYTDYQRLELEKEFRTSQFINSERKSQLSSQLQLTERQIKIWFQNRLVSVFSYDKKFGIQMIMHV
ncbi:hypothetical protein LOAG_15485 [Loa loa]|uniref:Homeobox domain-containing protein n=1 Tax=Loa loa TaxID=7209 RepID=A0A1S0TFP0_LOALO|nr:hypothetical protein LOAG_15485 [Loa loa]EFO13046.1 hypothetical protein LOAG_15485 [Loa loa]